MNILELHLITRTSVYKILIILLLIAGVVIRLYHFASDRSLWLDETYLTSGLIKFSLSDIVSGKMDYQQKAPIGFLISVKLILDAFGNKEIWLRLIPLLSGIMTLFIFVPLTNSLLKPAGRIFVIATVCLSPAFIYHSVEIKQYATEMFVTAIILNYFLIQQKSDSVHHNMVLSVLGIVAVWFSFTSAFILAGVVSAIMVDSFIKRESKQLQLYIVLSIVWAISFGINYYLYTYRQTTDLWTINWFRFYNNFMPFPPSTFNDLKWFFVAFYRMLDYPLGLLWNFNSLPNQPFLSALSKMGLVFTLLATVGLTKFVVLRGKIQLALLLPVVYTLLASGLELYPLSERFWVFLSPIILIVLGTGLDFVYYKIINVKFRVLLLILVILGPITQSLESLIRPDTFYTHKKSFAKNVLAYVNSNFRKEDAVYIYWNNVIQFKVYNMIERYRFSAIEGADFRRFAGNRQEYYRLLRTDLLKFKGKKRVWLVFNHKFLSNIGDPINSPLWYYEKKQLITSNLLEEFVNLGRLKEKIVTADVTVCLFELEKGN